MAVSTTQKNFFNACYQTVHNGIDKSFKLGVHVNEKLVLIALVVKVGQALIRAAPLIPGAEVIIPVSDLEVPLKDGKIITDVGKGFPSLEALMNGQFAKTWKILALNVSGLALMFFAIISGLNRLKVDVSLITELAKKVPFLGVLPFAGLLNLSILTMFGTLYLMSREKLIVINSKTLPKVNQKITNWSKPINADMINQRINYYSDYKKNKPNHQTKLAMWEKIEQNIVPELIIKNFSDQKKTKWERKLEKINLEITSCRVQKLISAVKIASIIAVSATIIIGVGITAATTFAIALALIEAGSSIKKYNLKNSIEAYKFEPVYL
jgi:hypothetical protein